MKRTLALGMVLNNQKYILKYTFLNTLQLLEAIKSEQFGIISQTRFYCNKFNKLIMYKSTQLKRQTKQPQFVKGMTLDQYLTNYTAFLPDDRQTQNDQKQQNLYESSHNGLRKRMQPKNSQLGIQEIDQESIEDSVEYEKPEKTRETPFFQQSQVRLRGQNQQILNKQSNNNIKTNTVLLNTHLNFKNSSIDKNSFRVKKLSMSPTKRKNDEPLGSGSVTLYGNKFGFAKKQQSKMPELLTFYGKLSIEQQQVKIKQKTSWKGGDMKQNFKKKNHLQLKQLLLVQNKIKTTKNLGISNRDMMVLGMKDKLNQRRQKHVQRL